MFYSIESLFLKRKSSKKYNAIVDLNFVLKTIEKIYYTEKKLIPSAGAIYQLDINIIQNKYKYHYNSVINDWDIIETNQAVSDIVFMEKVSAKSILIIICADFEKYTKKYYNQGLRYAIIEAGCLLQCLQLALCIADIKCCPIGLINDNKLDLTNESIISLLVNIN